MTLFHLWDLPGDVLAAPESASGLDRCTLLPTPLRYRPRPQVALVGQGGGVSTQPKCA